MEMTQLVAAIEDVRTKVGGGQYPPDGTNGTADTVQFLKAAFPRCPAVELSRAIYDGEFRLQSLDGTGLLAGRGPERRRRFHRLQRQSAEPLRYQRQPHRAAFEFGMSTIRASRLQPVPQ